jgi:hypothetical protein
VVVSTAFLTLVIAALVPMSLNMLPGLGWIGFAVLLAAFLFAALYYHMRLCETRPPEAGLTHFYFAMAVGGALGGLFNSVVAPIVFGNAIETPIVFALAELALSGQWRPLRDTAGAAAAVGLACGFLALVSWAGSLDPNGPALVFSAAALGGMVLLTARRESLRFPLTAAGFMLAGYGLFWNEGVIDRGRRFFGIYVVRDNDLTGMRELGHGTTQHGLQFIEDTGSRPRILSYYHPNSPMGQVFQSGEVKPDARIGVVGLGVGALSCYAQPGQHRRFYEIDGLIDEIARNTALFSYMGQCAGDAPTILGDARLTLAHDTSEDEKFDLLVIDAYSSDAIPVHLFTREALELYFSRIAPGGLLVFHISSRYYQLGPVLGVAARAFGVSAIEQLHKQTPEHSLAAGEGAAQVAMMARLPETLRPFADDPRWHVLKPGSGALWTDDHANILSALRAFE